MTELLHSGQKICHKLVAETAKEITFAVYEIMAHDDVFYKANPTAKRFVARQWKNFIGHARASLLVMLTPIPGTENDPDGPKYQAHEIMRNAIMEAFIEEGAFKQAPMSPQPYAGDLVKHGSLH